MLLAEGKSPGEARMEASLRFGSRDRYRSACLEIHRPSRVDLLKELWDYSTEVMTRTVDMHFAELRRKLEDDPATPRHIITVRKVGYRLQV